jgi:hypothetical protein
MRAILGESSTACQSSVLHSPVRPSWPSDGTTYISSHPSNLWTGRIPVWIVLGRDGLWSTAVDCQDATEIVHIVRVTSLLLECSGAVILSLFFDRGRVLIVLI